jgi:hypothetical protein
MYKLEPRDGKLYARKQKRGGGPLGGLEEVDQDWINTNKDSIFGFDDLKDSDNPMLRNAWTGSINQGLTNKISGLEKELGGRSMQQLLDDPQYQENVQKRNPEATLDEPVSRQSPEQTEEPNLASPGMNELRTGRAIGSFEGKRDRGEAIQENIQGDLLNSARRQIRGEDKKSKANERIQEIMDARERDLSETYNRSPYGAISSGKSFDELDDKTQAEMRAKFVKKRIAGVYDESQPKASTASQTREYITQEEFDNMSDADLERELTRVTGGASVASRKMPEDLVAGGGQSLDMPYNIPQETEFEPQVRPPQYDRAKDLSMVQEQTTADTPAMPKTEFMTRENNAPAPATAPAPAPAPAAEAKKPTPRYIPRYGSQGFMGFNEGSAKGRFIQAPQGQNQKTMLNNLLRQDNEDDENRKRFTDNNPFGTEFRPRAREYTGPVATAPTPRTDTMMRNINAMPQRQQLDVINSFRKHRGEDEIHNPFS